MNGTISVAISISSGTGLSGNTFSFGFYSAATDLPSIYAGLSVPYADDFGHTPLYADLFSAFSSSEQTIVQGIFSDDFGFANLNFSLTSGAGADIAFAGLNSTYSSSGGDLRGWTGAPFSHNGVGLGDVWLTNSGRSAGIENFTLIHEIGHALWLKDFNAVTMQFTVMSNNVPSGFNVPTEYQLYDIASLQYMYGAQSAQSGDTTYGDLDVTPVSHPGITRVPG